MTFTPEERKARRQAAAGLSSPASGVTVADTTVTARGATGRRRALGYVRVSTDEQAHKGHGLGIQRRAIVDYCKANGLTLVDILDDQGVSGSNGLDDRAGLAAALARIERGEASTLVVHRFDRLARQLLVQLTVMDRLAKAGAQVVSTSEPDIDGPDELRELIRNILGSVAAYERAVIRGRMLAGRRAKSERGGFIGGIPRYGFAVAGGDLVALEAEQIVVARIRALRAEGASLRAIAQALDAEGTRPKRGPRWHPAQVARVLAR
jgi:DNA invertase Pin-like site-specific DNA recombinase